MNAKTIRLNGAEFSSAFVQSFANYKDFAKSAENMAYFANDTKTKEKLFKTIYEIATKNEIPKKVIKK
jgi:hypothetical protein